MVLSSEAVHVGFYLLLIVRQYVDLSGKEGDVFGLSCAAEDRTVRPSRDAWRFGFLGGGDFPL